MRERWRWEGYRCQCAVVVFGVFKPIVHWPRTTGPLLAFTLGCCAIYNIRPKLILNSNLEKSRSSITFACVVQSFWNFTQSASVSLPCFVHNIKTIEQEIWVWNAFPMDILYCTRLQPPNCRTMLQDVEKCPMFSYSRKNRKWQHLAVCDIWVGGATWHSLPCNTSLSSKLLQQFFFKIIINYIHP